MLSVLIGIRICHVYKNARLPELIQIEQGETAEYMGIGYTLTDAEMMTYEDFFEENPQYNEFYYNEIGDVINVIVVELKLDFLSEDAVFTGEIPIICENKFNYYDVFLFAEMNPKLVDGTIESGDTVKIVYEVYESEHSEETWENIENMEYRLVLGGYPVKTEIIISDIDAGRLNK